MKNTRIAPMRSHIESASLTLRPNGSGAAVGDKVVVVASKSARADMVNLGRVVSGAKLFICTTVARELSGKVLFFGSAATLCRSR